MWRKAYCTDSATVPIPKFAQLRLSRGEFEGSHAEALDGGEDLVGRLVSPERLGVLVYRFDILGDRLLKLDGRAVNSAPDLLLRQIGEEPLHLVEP